MSTVPLKKRRDRKIDLRNVNITSTINADVYLNDQFIGEVSGLNNTPDCHWSLTGYGPINGKSGGKTGTILDAAAVLVEWVEELGCLCGRCTRYRTEG